MSRNLKRKWQIMVFCGHFVVNQCLFAHAVLWLRCLNRITSFYKSCNLWWGPAELVRSEISVKQQQTHGCVCTRVCERERERNWHGISADAVNQTHTLKSSLIPQHPPADCKSIRSVISEGYEREPGWE